MDLNAIVDVAIGLAFLYLLLGLFVTIVNDGIASLLKWRAKNLGKAIQDMLGREEFWAAFQSAPSFKSAASAAGRALGPSYLPGRRFTDAFLEALTAKPSATPGDGTKPGNWRIDPVKLAKVSSDVTSGNALRELKSAVDGLPDCPIKDQLQSMLSGVTEDVNEAKTRLADWFDDMMERASGRFKRRMQICSFCIALVLCVALNVDTFQVARELWEDEAVAAAIAGQADAYLPADEPPGETQTGDGADDPPGLTRDEVLAELNEFPIGWGERTPEGCCWLLSAIFGWLLSALAVSLGAPFWFDVLRRVSALRGTGGRPKRDDETRRPKPAA